MASTISWPRRTWRSTAWTQLSPSLSERTVIPSAWNWRRSSALLTTFPLCAPTIAPSESRCGWALTCDGSPNVAQRSCVIPRVPRISAKPWRAATASTLPTSFRRSIVPSPKVAAPTES